MSSVCPDCEAPITESGATCLKCLFQLGFQEANLGEGAESVVGNYRLVREIGRGGSL
mgnify:CR=1 FL=1